jgi:hypothetical protein
MQKVKGVPHVKTAAEKRPAHVSAEEPFLARRMPR